MTPRIINSSFYNARLLTPVDSLILMEYFSNGVNRKKKKKKNARNGNETVEIISFPRNGSVKQIYTFLMEPVDVSMKVFKIYTLHR